MLTQLLSPSRRASARVRPHLEARRVMMVTPPSVFLLDERVFISLGILKVAAVLEQAGHAVEFLDLSGIENFTEVVEAHLGTSAATIAAITTTTPQLPAVARIVAEIRRLRPSMRIVLGGPHVTLVHAAVKQEKKRGMIGRAHRAFAMLSGLVDVLVSGDGEEAIFLAIADDATHFIDADDHRSELFMDNDAYEASPMPARHLVDVPSYRYTIEGHAATTLIAQLGCPFKCSFCGGRAAKSLRMIRSRTTESVIREMEHLHETYGFTGFNFFDDELNVNKGLVDLMNAVADLQARLGVEFRLRGFVKAELFTEEQAEAMHRAGFRWLLCGFEAANPRILENIEKRATLEDNTRVVEICRTYGLKVKALMSVGHAGESEASIRDVERWLVDVQVDEFDVTVITTYPGCPYYDEAVPHVALPDVWTYTAKKSGDRLHAYDVDFTKVADYYKGDPEGGYTSYVFTDHLTPKEIVALRDDVESSVRKKLGIPFNAASPARRYEHSMGQSPLPAFVLRTSEKR
jgi:anaerobic magnesium-protoporphyrin IX monomethyl ester cyclase